MSIKSIELQLDNYIDNVLIAKAFLDRITDPSEPTIPHILDLELLIQTIRDLKQSVQELTTALEYISINEP